MNIRRSLFIFILITVFSLSAFSQLRYSGKVVEIVDGKTIIVELQTNNRLTVELQYIEVPEPEQELYQTVKDHLQQLLLGKNVEFRANGLTPNKTVGQIFFGDVDISQQMIRDGAAWYAVLEKERQDSAESQKYLDTEKQAKIENRGVWSITKLKPAWEFRAEKEEQLKAAQQKETLAQLLTKGPAKSRGTFGQPRYFADSSQQPDAAMDMWGGDFGNYFSDENVNAVGLASRYSSEHNIGYLATTLKNFKLSSSNSPKMIYRIIYYYTGSTPKLGDETFFIGFLSESKSWQFLQSHSLSVLADGQTISMGNGYRLFRKNSTSVQELLLYKIPRQALAKISNSKRVEFKVGKYIGLVEKSSQNSVGKLLEYSK